MHATHELLVAALIVIAVAVDFGLNYLANRSGCGHSYVRPRLGHSYVSPRGMHRWGFKVPILLVFF